MKMLLYAGASNEDIERRNGRNITPTLRLRADGKELSTEDLVGKTFKVLTNNPILGIIIAEIGEGK